MTESTGSRVECSACGEVFDPRATAGCWSDLECDECPREAAAGRPAGDHNRQGQGTLLADGGTDDVRREVTEIGGTTDRDTPGCPECGATIEPGSDFCPSCGAEVPDADTRETDESLELTACPGCGSDVDTGDSYCASCGQDLEAVGAGELLSECPACRADVGPGDSFCSSCGENLEAHRVDEDAPESLLLATRGQEIAVGDGDTVGRELRRVVIETGGDETQAVRIHREHLRFVRENGQFHVVDLGTNPTRLNGRPLEKGDREPVSPGDEIEVSGVVGFVIREP
jgi:DNA-directed RNA polymerase subunit RPC12/RpoP